MSLRARLLLACVATSAGFGFVIASARLDTTLLGAALTVLLGALVVSAVGVTSPVPADRATGRRPYQAFMWTQHLAHLALLGTVGLPLLR